VPWEKVRNDIATIVPVPKDRRSIFVVPWGDFTYIGTTDTDYDGDADDPQCTPEDVQYCLDAMNLAMSEPLTHADVTGVWAGLRPLIAGGSVGDKTKDLSHKHGVSTSPGGVTTITGGKLTTYRTMSAEVVDRVVKQLGHKTPSTTGDRPLPGARGYEDSDEAFTRFTAQLGRADAEAFTSMYGARAKAVLERCAAPDASQRLDPELPWLLGQVDEAVDAELAQTLDDVLSRRLSLVLRAKDQGLGIAPVVAQRMAQRLGWSEARTAQELEAYRAVVASSRAWQRG